MYLKCASNLLCNQGWPPTPDPPASTVWGWGLLACTNRTSFPFNGAQRQGLTMLPWLALDSLCAPTWPGIHGEILFLLPSECWNYRDRSPCPVFLFLFFFLSCWLTSFSIVTIVFVKALCQKHRQTVLVSICPCDKYLDQKQLGWWKGLFYLHTRIEGS